MTQEQKDLLLKDLCGRLPYGVKAVLTRTNCRDSVNKVSEKDIYSFRTGRPLEEDYGQHDYYRVVVTDIKPYLFPMSSMSEEQKIIYGDLCYAIIHSLAWDTQAALNELVDWLNENHFDYNNLIPMGLSLDATGLNIY